MKKRNVFKKVLSSALTFVMALSAAQSMTAVMADEQTSGGFTEQVTIDTDGALGWKIGGVNPNVGEGGTGHKKTLEIRRGTGVGHNGSDSALYLNWELTTGAESSDYIGFVNDALATYAAKSENVNTATYNVEFYIKMLSEGYDSCPLKIDTAMWASNRMHPVWEDADENGWRKVTITTTAQELASPRKHDRVTFALQYGLADKKAEFYLDDVTVTKVGDTTNTNLVENGDFERMGQPVVDVTAPAHIVNTSIWKYRTNSNSFEFSDDKNIIALDSDNAYEGDRSLYVNFTPSNDTEIRGFTATGVDSNDLSADKKYKATLYIKGSKISRIYVNTGFTQSTTGGAANMVNLANVYPEMPENADKAKDGWRKYTVLLDASKQKFFEIIVQQAGAFYIDNVSLVDVDNPTVNLIKEQGFEVSMPDIDYEDMPVELVTHPDPTQGSNAAIVTSDVVMAVTSQDAHSGRKSVRVRASKSGVNKVFYFKPLIDKYDETYTLSFWSKGSNPKGKDGVTFIHGAPGNYIPIESSEEWEYHTYTFAPDQDRQWLRLYVNNACDVYIDDIEFKKNGVAVDSGSYDFETQSTGTELVNTVFLDESMNTIPNFSTDISGKNVTIGTWLNNYETTAQEAQIIVGLYDGYMLKQVVMSDKSNIAGGGGALLKANITLPEFSEVGDLKLMVYAWDSVGGMKPLGHVSFLPVVE